MSYDGIVKIYRHIAGDTTDPEITQWIDLNSININVGRTSITDQPAPSVASFTVITQAGDNPVPLDLNEPVRIMSFGTSDAVYGTCWFIGTISDSGVSVRSWSGGTGLVSTQYTAVSLLGQLNRASVGASGYVKQYDSDRIRSILTDCSVGTTYVPVGQTYEIAAYSKGATSALALAQEAANSAKGVLYDDVKLTMGYHLPYIVYDSSTVRITNPVNTITDDMITASLLTLDASMTDCATVVKVTDHNGTGTTYTAAVGVTTLYGFQYGERSTTLHNTTDANTIGQELLAAKSEPKYRVRTLSFNLASPGVDLSDVPLYIGARVSFSLPDPLNAAGLVPVTYEGFVEGWTVQFSRGQIVVTLNLSNYGDLYPYTYWSTAATATDTWQTAYTATTTWEDIT